LGRRYAEAIKRKGGPGEEQYRRKTMEKEEEKVLSKQHGLNPLTAAFSLAPVQNMSHDT